jgi:hypothetical protein
MRRRVSGATLAVMQSSTIRKLVLDAAIDGSVIRGTLTTPAGERREFHGWLELNAAVEAMLDGDDDRGSGESSPAGASARRHRGASAPNSPPRIRKQRP